MTPNNEAVKGEETALLPLFTKLPRRWVLGNAGTKRGPRVTVPARANPMVRRRTRPVPATLFGDRSTTQIYTRSILGERRIERKTFIRLAAVLGLSPAAASALNSSCAQERGVGDAAKSTSSTTTEQAQGEQTQDTTQNTKTADSDGVGEGEPIAKVDEVPLNSSKKFTRAGSKHPYVLVHLKDGRFVAYSAVCTHEGCWVDYQPETQKLACPCHGSVFDPVEKGAVETGPATVPLPNIDLKVTGKEVKLA
jgi:Rieske Fe-S protein